MVREKRHENLLHLVEKLYDTVNVTLDTNCICAVRRIAKINPKSDRPRNILLTLQTERQRDILLSAVKRYNKTNHPNHLNSTCLGIEGEYRAIYVNEHLSSTTKKLYAEARKFAKDNSYKYVWVKYERVYMRKNDNESASLIRDFSNFEKLKVK
ncbi:unnamed protein product [Parnassius apollo]|uniref:(apollo) hypothetical protein n=1 Tax=Parnassius apollo TaxID=110799 RepID=A0A8S3XEM2_PARAO|nr:unnamed protein product [Parnassius apollo]